MDIVESSRSPEEEGDTTLPRSSSSVCTMLGSLAAAVCGTGGDEPQSATEKLLSPPSRQCYTASVRPGAFGLSMRLSDRLVVEHVPGPSRPDRVYVLSHTANLLAHACAAGIEARAGIEVGHQLLECNGHSCAGLTPAAFAALVSRQPSQTPINLLLSRELQGEPTATTAAPTQPEPTPAAASRSAARAHIRKAVAVAVQAAAADAIAMVAKNEIGTRKPPATSIGSTDLAATLTRTRTAGAA